MIASLPMYDWPEVRAVNDTFWDRLRAALSRAGLDAPNRLSRRDALAPAWQDPDLVLSQTCGLPYVRGACGSAVLVARPTYAVEGAGEGTYASALVCRAGETAPLAAFRGRRAAVNGRESQSGCNALADAVRPLGRGPFFGEVVISGEHRKSAAMVADGDADLAAIDAVAWALFATCEPERHDKLAVVGWTAETPALPFITSARHAAQIPMLRQTFAEALAGCPGHVALPARILPAVDGDYAPVRAMARRVRGTILSPGDPPLE